MKTSISRIVMLVTVGLLACATTSLAASRLKGPLTRWEITPLEPYDVAITADGTVWSAADNVVFSFDPLTGATSEYTFGTSSSASFKMLIAASDGGLWLTEQIGNRIVHFDGTGYFYYYPLPHPLFADPSMPFALAEAPDGAIWFTVVESDYSVGRLVPSTASFERFEPPGGTSRGYPATLALDSSGAVWLTRTLHYGTPGLSRLVRGSGFTTWNTPYTGTMSPFGIVLIDDEPWFLDHHANKLVHFNPATEVFTTYDTPDNVIDAHLLTVGADGLLYTVALATDNIAAFDPTSRRWVGTRPIGLPYGAASMGIDTAPDGSIWWATDSMPSEDFGALGRYVPMAAAGIAMGAPGHEVDGAAAAGAVVRVAGGSEGLTGADNQLWHQNLSGIDPAVAGEKLGYALASGDFNCDTFIDLAVGVPYETVSGHANAGAVHIVFGAENGALRTAGSQVVTQDTTGILEDAEDNDTFGWALAAGDFDSDGCDDLAVGVPAEGRSVAGCGLVNVIYGSPTGLTLVGNGIFWQGGPGMVGDEEGGDRFGHALASGDFDSDGYDDLAIGVPWEDDGLYTTDSGVVQVIHGGDLGLSAAHDLLYSQDTVSMPGTVSSGDRFGWAVTAGDFNNDGYDDLAIGAPYDDVGSVTQAGTTTVLYGSATSLSTTGVQLWHQDVSGVEGGAETGDAFGQALTSGDYDGDGFADLAIGVPFEAISTITWAGAVNILYGAASGLSVTGDQMLSQNTLGMAGECEAQDRFAFRVSSGDYDGDGYDDLAVGVPFESIGTVDEAGGVHILFGTATGITMDRNHMLHQDKAAVPGVSATDVHLGYALAALYRTSSLIFDSGFESGGVSGWSSSAP